MLYITYLYKNWYTKHIFKSETNSTKLKTESNRTQKERKRRMQNEKELNKKFDLQKDDLSIPFETRVN